MTIYGTPEKLQDGRYYVKISNPPITLVNVKITKDSDGFVVTMNDSSGIQSIENKIIDDASINSVEWFKKEIARDVISGIFQSSLDNNSLVCEETFTNKGKSTSVFFDESKNLVDFNPDYTYTALIQLDGIWFLKKTFGTTWRLIQARAKKPQKKVECMIPDEDSD